MDDKDEKFSSVTELYKRVLPALETKVKELSRENIRFVKCTHIWSYCVSNYWKNKRDLRMYEIVSDILNCDGVKLERYIKENNYKKIDKE